MYSKQLSKTLHLTFLVAKYLGATSISFDEVTLECSHDPTAIPSLHRNFRLGVRWSVLVLLIILKYSKAGDVENYHLTISWWLALNIILTVFSISVYFGEELCQSVDGLTTLIQRLRCDYIPKLKKHKKRDLFLLLDTFIVAIVICCFAIFLLTSFQLVYDPGSIIFLGGLFPEKYLYFPFKLVIIVFHLYLMALFFASIPVAGGVLFLYSFYLYYFVSRELRLGKTFYRATGEFRGFSNITTIYRSLQVLHSNTVIVSLHGLYLVALNAMCMVVGIYALYVMMRFWAVLSPVTKAPMIVGSLFLFGYWTFILQIGCLLSVGGNKTLRTWRKHNWGFPEQNKLMRKFTRSCKPIMFSYGTQFVVTRVTVMNFYRGVVRGTFRSLLAAK